MVLYQTDTPPLNVCLEIQLNSQVYTSMICETIIFPIGPDHAYLVCILPGTDCLVSLSFIDYIGFHIMVELEGDVAHRSATQTD